MPPWEGEVAECDGDFASTKKVGSSIHHNTKEAIGTAPTSVMHRKVIRKISLSNWAAERTVGFPWIGVSTQDTAGCGKGKAGGDREVVMLDVEAKCSRRRRKAQWPG